MLEDLLKNALDGFTAIEESSGSVSKLLARQLGAFARASGRKVAFISLLGWEPGMVMREETRVRVNPSGTETTAPSSIGLTSGQGGHPRNSSTPFLDGGNYDMLIVDALSSFLFDREERDSGETIRQLSRMVKQGKSLIVTFDAGIIGEKTAAYIRATADTLIVVKTELIGDKVNRTLYVPKMRDSRPLDRLIKITVDETGVQVDTREFVG